MISKPFYCSFLDFRSTKWMLLFFLSPHKTQKISLFEALKDSAPMIWRKVPSTKKLEIFRISNPKKIHPIRVLTKTSWNFTPVMVFCWRVRQFRKKNNFIR